MLILFCPFIHLFIYSNIGDFPLGQARATANLLGGRQTLKMKLLQREIKPSKRKECGKRAQGRYFRPGR